MRGSKVALAGFGAVAARRPYKPLVGGSIPSISIVLLGKIITTTDAGVLANNPNRGAYDDRHIKG